jgi:hypothetical protein
VWEAFSLALSLGTVYNPSTLSKSTIQLQHTKSIITLLLVVVAAAAALAGVRRRMNRVAHPEVSMTMKHTQQILNN